MELSELYDLADRQNIPVFSYHLRKNESVSFMSDSGNCYIGMDPHILDNGFQEKTHLIHELGHCITGSFYNQHAAIDYRKRHENQADKWAIQALIPVNALDTAIAEGCTEIWELAERFDVSEEFMQKAVCYYVHGNLAAELYF